MSEFPPELLHEILVRLPPDDLIRCLCVSKPWNSFISQQSFIKSHLRRSIETNSDRILILMIDTNGCFCTLPFEDDDRALRVAHPVKIDQPLKFSGGGYTHSLSTSVHGLLCLVNHHQELFALWNPSIQKLRKIPFPTTIEHPKWPSLEWTSSICYGFGYDSVNDDYKLAQIAFTAACLVVNIYSLKRKSWKRISKSNLPSCFHEGGFTLYSEEALCSGGHLCWMMRKPLGGHRRRYMIMTLDLATEEYGEFQPPVDVYQLSTPALAVLGGYLCIHAYYYAGYRYKEHDVWIMKEFGVTESWTLIYSAVESHLREPLVFSKNRERVLSMDSLDRFFWYDLRKKMAEQVENPRLRDCHNPTVCVQSLCLLDGEPVTGRMQQDVPKHVPIALMNASTI